MFINGAPKWFFLKLKKFSLKGGAAGCNAGCFMYLTALIFSILGCRISTRLTLLALISSLTSFARFVHFGPTRPRL